MAGIIRCCVLCVIRCCVSVNSTLHIVSLVSCTVEVMVITQFAAVKSVSLPILAGSRFVGILTHHWECEEEIIELLADKLSQQGCSWHCHVGCCAVIEEDVHDLGGEFQKRCGFECPTQFRGFCGICRLE